MYAGYGRIVQMLKCHLFSASSATSQFHLVLSDGAAQLLRSHLSSPQMDNDTRMRFQHAYDSLTSTNPLKAHTSGLWMTERAGGSDLTPTQTTARFLPQDTDSLSTDTDGFSLGPWVLDGFKWFSTGTETDMAVTVARAPHGLSAFLVSTHRRSDSNSVCKSELNGFRARRLKNKVGTHALPTAELEISGMRGWLIGKEGEGIKEIGIILNVTRLHLAVMGLGAMGRSLAAAGAFAKVRKVARGTRLCDVPLHMRTLADLHIDYRAHMFLTYFATMLLAVSEQIPGAAVYEVNPLIPVTSGDVQSLLRLLSTLSKVTVAKATCSTTQAAMESLGGVGYLENDNVVFNIARLYRDAPALTIGEGTTDVLVTDVIKVLKGKIGPHVRGSLNRWSQASIPKNESMKWDAAILVQQQRELDEMVSRSSMEYLLLHGRSIVHLLFRMVSGVLLADAARDNNPVGIEIAKRWIRPQVLTSGSCVQKALSDDQQIVFGLKTLSGSVQSFDCTLL
ncbi:hypothetical protein LTR49_026844 [Elasticomyces elasticus]|nr:hypothetical protein LTR49_026844 [Elasticomyces elasticus]